MGCWGNRILKIKKKLPSCSLTVILFLEQGVEIKNFPSLLYQDLIIENFYMATKTEFELNVCASDVCFKVLISTLCSINRITIKVQYGEFFLDVKIPSLNASFPYNSVISYFNFYVVCTFNF